jgi:hypothetical protein
MLAKKGSGTEAYTPTMWQAGLSLLAYVSTSTSSIYCQRKCSAAIRLAGDRSHREYTVPKVLK